MVTKMEKAVYLCYVHSVIPLSIQANRKRLTSIDISLVLLILRCKKASSHQDTSHQTGPCSFSCVFERLTITESSANLMMYLLS